MKITKLSKYCSMYPRMYVDSVPVFHNDCDWSIKNLPYDNKGSFFFYNHHSYFHKIFKNGNLTFLKYPTYLVVLSRATSQNISAKISRN